MLTILLDPNSPKPLYAQIAEAVREEIRNGNLQPEEALPSRRALANHLQVSVTTVQTAYDQLVSEGYLYSKPKVGYFVDPAVWRLLSSPTDLVSMEISEEKPEKPADWIDFSTGGVDVSQFPFATWAKLSRQVLTEYGSSLLQDVPPMGVYALRQSIANHLYAYRHIRVQPEQILFGAGTEYLLGLLVQLLGPSQRIAVEDPGYPKAKRVIRAHGAAVLAIPMDDQGVRLDALQQSGASVLYVTPSHQFPTGIVMSLSRRIALIDWVRAQPGRYILEDDYDSDLVFHGNPLPSLYTLDGGQHVIYLHTFTRTLAPTLRMSYMVLPPQLAKRWKKEFSFYTSTIPAQEQYTLLRFLEDGYLEQHMNRMRKQYTKRQKALLNAIHAHTYGTHITVYGEEAGLHLVLEVDTSSTEQELVDAATRAHISISGLSTYFDAPPVQQKHKPCIVLGYAKCDEQEIQNGVQRLLDAFANTEK